MVGLNDETKAYERHIHRRNRGAKRRRRARQQVYGDRRCSGHKWNISVRVCGTKRPPSRGSRFIGEDLARECFVTTLSAGLLALAILLGALGARAQPQAEAPMDRSIPAYVYLVDDHDVSKPR